MRAAPTAVPAAGPPAAEELRLLLPRWLEESPLLRIGLGLLAILVVGAAASRGPIFGVLAVAVVGFAILVAHRPFVGILIMAAAVPVTSGIARGIPVPGFRISELITALVAGTILATTPRERTRPWAIFDVMALAYALATALLGTADLVMRHAAFSLEGVGTLLGPVQFLLMYRATLVVVRGGRERLWCLYALIAASVPVSVLGVLQQLNVGPARALQQTLTASNLSSDFSFQLLARATGPFEHWQALGGYLFIILLIGVALLGERPSPRMRWALIGVLALDSCALLLSVSIAPTVCAVIGAAAISVWASRRVGWERLRPVVLVALAAIVVSLAFMPLIEQRAALQFGHGTSAGHDSLVPHTLAYRYEVWSQQYIPALQQNWLTGYGPDLPPQIHWQYTESLYFTLLLRGGVVLLLTFIGLMIAAAARARAAARDSDQGARVAGRVLFVAVIALVFMHAEIPYFVNSGLPHVFWILVALAGSRTLETARARGAPGRWLGAV